jgi:excisionase family DNA binding protein
MKLITIDEVTELWRCHRITVLRLIKRGQLHPVEVDGDLRFDCDEVLRLKNRKIAVYPHFTVKR